MPLVKIDVIKDQRSREELRILADVIQQVLLDHFHAPPRDRYQVSCKNLLRQEQSRVDCYPSQLD